jgi:hypothetical protein
MEMMKFCLTVHARVRANELKNGERAHNKLTNGEVFGRLDYPHDLSHDLSERTVYIPSASLCCYDQQRAIIASTRDVLVAESFDKGLAACSHPTKTARSEQYNQLALSARNIHAGWPKAGLFPLYPDRVLRSMTQRTRRSGCGTQ